MFDGIQWENKIIEIYKKTAGIILTIAELEDEYFLVTIVSTYYDINEEDRFYKCDQLDGIKELLEDLKIIPISLSL